MHKIILMGCINMVCRAYQSVCIYLPHGCFALLNSDHTLLNGPFTDKSSDLYNPRVCDERVCC